jgi:gliding motility-associated-like protein
MLKRYLYIFLLLVTTKQITAQCPQIYDYLGNLVTKPYFIDCQGTGVYNMNVSSNTGWGAYTINWGDGTSNAVGGSYPANSLINHVYNSATPDTFQITIITSAPNCTITGIAVMEKPVNASIQIPIGGVTTACAPHMLSFSNSSTDVSQTTVFTWNFGDGSPIQTFNYTNAGQTISHMYLHGTVNCQTAVTLTAKNYCTTIPTIANFNPIQIYDIDNANITPSAIVKCWPDNTFSFTNTTNRNCVPQGNTFQRQERWHFGNYWGLGHDSIVGWKPWPPSTPMTITYPSVGSYNVVLEDSNLCGINTKTITVIIVNPPTAGVLAPTIPLCQGSVITFTNTSGTGYIYKWDFGDGGGFITKPFGPQTHTYGSAGTYTVALVALVAGGGSACTDTAKVVITILPKPTANFSVTPNTGCDKIIGVAFTDLSISAIAWNWNFGNGNTFNGILPPSQNYTTTGNFVASLTVTAANTCVNSFTTPIAVYAKPVAAFSPAAACVAAVASFTDNSTVGFGGPIIGWNWNFGDASPTATSSVQNPTHIFTTQSTYTTQLIVNTANCADTVLQNILINVKPTADFTLTPINGCPTLSVNFTNTSANATSYNWNLGNGATSTLTNTSQVYTNTLTTNKTYTVSLTAQTGAGCADTHTAAVTVFPKPTASFTLTAPLGCSPIAATFTNNSIGSTSYIWTFGDAISSNSSAAVLSHIYTNSTLLLQTYTAQLVAISSNGCKDSTSLNIQIYPKPIFNFTMVPNSGCSPLSINFPPVLGAVSYTWDYGDGSPLSNVANPTHTFTNSTTSDLTYSVQLIASNAFSCIDTTYGYPVVYAKPLSNFVLTPTVGCSPLAVSYTNTSISATTYLWKFGDGTTASTANTNHTYSNLSNTVNQTFSCTLVAITSNGCRDSINKTLLVYYKPNASFAIDTPKCVSKTITFTNTTLGVTSSNWDFGDFSTTSSLTNPIHTYTNLTSGNLTFTTQLIVASADGCKDTTLGYPVIYAKPIVNAAVTPTVSCSPLNVSMSNSSLFATSYLWKFGDGTTSASSNTFHTYSNLSNVSNQSYSCTLIAINSISCKDSIIQPITVFYNPKADFTVDTPSCSPKTLTFINTSLGAINFNWDFGTRTSTNLNESQQYINSTTTNITHTVQLIVTSANNCKDTIIVPIVVHPKPDFPIVATPDSGCAPLSVKFPLISGVASYQWNFGDNNISSSGDVTNIYYNYSQTTKIFTVQLIGIDAYGCRDTSTKVIRVFAKPIAVFQVNPNTVFVPIDPVVCINLSSGATNYSWNFGDNSSSTEINPSHLYMNAGEYQIDLIAINAKGCRDTFRLPSKITAVLESDVDVPNAFSPNPTGGNGGTFGVNDVNNDVFHPVLRGIDKYELNIFSRWGELLFVSKDVNIGWDGYYKGKLCTQDVYVWKIIATTIDGKKINKTGDLLLLR